MEGAGLKGVPQAERKDGGASSLFSVSLSLPLLLFLPLRLSQGVFVCLILFRVLPSVAGVIIAAHMLPGL